MRCAFAKQAHKLCCARGPLPRRHYLHTMEGSQVNSVSVDAATGAAKVSATFREAVVAHRGAADPVQAFRQGPALGRSGCAAAPACRHGHACSAGLRPLRAGQLPAIVDQGVRGAACCTGQRIRPTSCPSRRSEYIVDYELAPEDGSWVITAATVRS